MRRAAQDSVSTDAGVRRRRFRLSFYSGAVLLVLFILFLTAGKGKASVLFDENSPVTLYAKTEAGVKPELNAAKYFPKEELDPAKFSYGWEDCDLKTPGKYLIPVYYGGRLTDCVIQLEVLQDTGGTPGITGLPKAGERDQTSLRSPPAQE